MSFQNIKIVDSTPILWLLEWMPWRIQQLNQMLVHHLMLMLFVILKRWYFTIFFKIQETDQDIGKCLGLYIFTVGYKHVEHTTSYHHDRGCL